MDSFMILLGLLSIWPEREVDIRDLRKFPSSQYCDECLNWNYKYHVLLNTLDLNEVNIIKRCTIMERRTDNLKRRLAWRILYLASNSTPVNSYNDDITRYLKELRDCIGYDNYYQGRMPDFVDRDTFKKSEGEDLLKCLEVIEISKNSSIYERKK